MRTFFCKDTCESMVLRAAQNNRNGVVTLDGGMVAEAAFVGSEGGVPHSRAVQLRGAMRANNVTEGKRRKRATGQVRGQGAAAP